MLFSIIRSDNHFNFFPRQFLIVLYYNQGICKQGSRHLEIYSQNNGICLKADVVF